MHEEGTLRSFFFYLKKRKVSLKQIIQIIRHKKAYAVFAKDDFLPCVGSIIDIFRRVVKRIVSGKKVS